MWEAGFPSPILQHPFWDDRGFIGFADFFWPAINLIGEFDGNQKYFDEVMLEGMSPREALLKEKRRENRLRALGPTMTRWDWPEALEPGVLQRKLRLAGLAPSSSSE